MAVNLSVRVGVEWVDTFHPDKCKQANLSYCDEQAEGFYNTMGARGHVQVFDWGQDNSWETDFTAPRAEGDSRRWSDDVHICMYDSYGGNWDDVLHITSAHPHQCCQSASSDWDLGANMLKWMIFAGCDAVLNTSAAHGSDLCEESISLWAMLARVPTPGRPLIWVKILLTTYAIATQLPHHGAIGRIPSGLATTRLLSPPAPAETRRSIVGRAKH